MSDAKVFSQADTYTKSTLKKSRNALSQTVVLAQRYGGPVYEQATNQILQKSQEEITAMNVVETTDTAPDTTLASPKRKLRKTRKSKQRSVDRPGKQPSLVQATLMTNSSGIQLTYRGHGVLPMLSSHKNRSSLAASLTKLNNNRSQVQLIKPVSQSQRLSMDLKK